MATETKIMAKLNEIKTELDFIKERLVDVDSVFTEEDIKSLDEAEKDFKKGKTERL